MKFKSKETGVIWDIVDETHIKRCEDDPNYEKVANKKQTEKKEKPKEQIKQANTQTKKKTATKSKVSK